MAQTKEEKYRNRNVKRRNNTTGRLNAKAREGMENLVDGNFSLIQKIKESPFYGKRGNDERARLILEQDLKHSKAKVQPGQLCIFKYFEPIHKEELEYYDASPVTIFFGTRMTKDGSRHIVGFNIHYYPPQIRYAVMNKIFEIYKPIYLKHWDEGRKQVTDFGYKQLIEGLKKAKLDFGIREYEPRLVADISFIPPKYWQIAVFTEGWFKKQTRQAILNYWSRYKGGNRTQPKQENGKIEK